VPNANEDRFLGALLGMAIGDALGMPVEGWSRERIAERYGALDGYHLRVFADGTEVKAGEFTDETEIALCVVESLTANDGVLDPENVGARMAYLARGESKRWMGADTLAALERAEETLSFRVAIDEDGPATGEVAARGVPIGLLHAVGGFDPERFRADVEGVVRLSHGSPAAIAAATAVAYGVRLAARGRPRASGGRPRRRTSSAAARSPRVWGGRRRWALPEFPSRRRWRRSAPARRRPSRCRPRFRRRRRRRSSRRRSLPPSGLGGTPTRSGRSPAPSPGRRGARAASPRG